MSTINLFSSIIFALITTPRLAWAVPVENSSCPAAISHVAGSAGAFYNQDCTKIYVLPPSNANLSMNSYWVSRDLAVRCQALEKNYAAEYSLSKESEFDKTTKMNEVLIDQVKIAAGVGARGEFSIDSGSAKIIRAYREANPKAIVEALPVEQWFVGVNERPPSEFSPGQAILSLNLLNSSAVAGWPAGTKIFHEGITGEIQFSYTGACGLASGFTENNGEDRVKDFVTASLSYSYWLQTGGKMSRRYGVAAVH